MTGYKPCEERLALLDALEAELLAAPEAEIRAALAVRGGEIASRVDQVIAAALDDAGMPPGPPGLDGFRFSAAPKGH